MKAIASEVYELAKIQTSIQESIVRAEVIMKSKAIKGGTKYWIKNTILNRLNAIKNDLLSALPHEDAQILKDDVLSDETALQLRGITDMFLAMDGSKRDQVEEFMTELLNA